MATVDLTSRELTLIRVALIQRLDRLKHGTRHNLSPTDIANSYEETRALLSGKLWAARQQEDSNEPQTK